MAFEIFGPKFCQACDLPSLCSAKPVIGIAEREFFTSPNSTQENDIELPSMLPTATLVAKQRRGSRICRRGKVTETIDLCPPKDSPPTTVATLRKSHVGRLLNYGNRRQPDRQASRPRTQRQV